MAHRFDFGTILKSTFEKIPSRSVLMIVCTDSKSLYDYLVKLRHTQEKRLMIDVMCLWQAYKQREILEVKWIDRNTNLVDAMTKANPCSILQRLVNTNIINIHAKG